MEITALPSLRRELSATEAVTVVTVAALVFAVIYNFGFFSALDTSFITLLSAQDLIIGSATALLPTALSLEIVMRFNRWVVAGKGMGRVWVGIAVMVTVVGGAAIGSIAFHIREAGLFLSLMSVAILVSSLISDLVAKRPVGLYVFAAITLWNFVYTFGQVFFQFAILGYTQPSYEVVHDSGTTSGRVIRETSNYTFVFDGKNVIIIPNNKIHIITKLDVGTK